MAGRPNRGSRHGQKPTGENTVDPDWKPRPARAFAPEVGAPNLTTVTHGARSPVLVSQDAEEMIERFRETMGMLWIEQCDGLVLDTLIRAVARWKRIDDHIADTDIMDVPDRLWQQVDREQRHIVSAAGKLGLTSVDRAALMKDGAWAKALAARSRGPQLGERGRAMRAAQGRLPAGSEPHDAGGDRA